MIQIHAVTEAGEHVQNEDAFEIRPHPRDSNLFLCVVADGQGGQPHGGPAARLACQTCIASALTYPPERLIFPGTWTTLLRNVDRTVAEDSTAGLTTTVAFAATNSVVCGASSGDSAAVLIRVEEPAKILTRNCLLYTSPSPRD